MAMIMVSNTFYHSLFSFENSKLSFLHPGSASQLMMFPHAHGSQSNISKIDLMTIDTKVRPAAQPPTAPILFAMTSSFFCKSVSSFSEPELSEMIPAAVFSPTDVTIALPNPLSQRDLARMTPITPS